MSPYDFQSCLVSLYEEPFSLKKCANQALERLAFTDHPDETEIPLINVFWRVVEAVETEGNEREIHFAELQYHNRRHVGATLTALSCFLLLDDVLSRHDQLVALIAMAGHDYGHQGKSNKELGACQELLTAKTLVKHCIFDLPQDLQDKIATLIIGTDPQRVAMNHQRFLEAPLDANRLLQVLVNEADVAASLLPVLGDALTRRVLIERGASNPEGAEIDALYEKFKTQALISSAPARALLEIHPQ